MNSITKLLVAMLLAASAAVVPARVWADDVDDAIEILMHGEVNSAKELVIYGEMNPAKEIKDIDIVTGWKNMQAFDTGDAFAGRAMMAVMDGQADMLTLPAIASTGYGPADIATALKKMQAFYN